VHSWLNHTVHCAEKGQGEVGGVTHRATCTWWLLGLAVKGPCMVGTGWATSRPDCMDRLENTTLTF